MARPDVDGQSDPGAHLDPLVHVGYPKTGTTLLQNRLFAHDPAIINLGRPQPDYEWGHDGVRPALLSMSDEAFESRVAAIREAWRDRVREAGRGRPVVSDEHLSTGALTSPWARVLPSTAVRRIARLWPNARILVVLRRQPAILAATYQNDLRMDRTRLSADSWLGHAERDGTSGILEAFDFDARLEELVANFGADRVQVILHEDFDMAPERVVGPMAEATGIPSERVARALAAGSVNATSRAETVYLNLRRRLPAAVRRNRLTRILRPMINLRQVRRLGPYLGRGRTDKSVFGGRSEAVIRAFYAASNARLAARLGRDLGPLGYPMPSDPATGPDRDSPSDPVRR